MYNISYKYHTLPITLERARGTLHHATSAHPAPHRCTSASHMKRAASRSVLAEPIEEICWRKPPERTPETRSTTVMSWSARTGSRGGRQRASLASTTSSKIARHTEQRARPAFHRQPIDAKNVGRAHRSAPLSLVSVRARGWHLDGWIELGELLSDPTSHERQAVDGRCGVKWCSETDLKKSVRHSKTCPPSS